MDTLFQDIRFAVRSLRRTPGFTAVVVVVMALGIGVNTMVFSMVYGIMFRPWPLPHSDRIMAVSMTEPRRGFTHVNFSWQNFHELQQRTKSFETLGGYWKNTALVTLDREAEKLEATVMTAELLPALGIQPALGRNFSRDENVWGRNFNQVIISDRIWRQRYHADRNVLGRTLKLNGRVRQIVGVMPPGIRYPEIQDFFIPAGYNAAEDHRSDNVMRLVGRLKPGVTEAQARAELSSFMATLARQYPEDKEFGITVKSIQQDSAEGPGPFLMVLLYAVVFVLLIACANVANLMLARSATRRREISLRLALGATRGRIIRQLLTESVIISLAGGAVGVLVGYWGNAIWPHGIPLELPFYMRFPIDAPVLAYTALLTVFSGIVFGLAPALHGADESLAGALREGSQQSGTSARGNRLRNSLVIAEVAFSLVLLIGAGLMLRSFTRVTAAGEKLNREGMVKGEILLPIALYPGEAPQRRFFQDLVQKLKAQPGVTAVSGMSNLPLSRDSNQGIVLTPATGDPKNGILTNYGTAMPGNFAILGIAMLKGREFTDQDAENAPRVAVINESLARKLFPGKDALGQRLRLNGEPDSVGWRTVVGVAADVQMAVEGRDNSACAMWDAEFQNTQQSMTLLVRAGGDGSSGAAALRRVMRSLNPNLPVMDLRTMTEELRFSLWVERFFASMVGVFAVLALIIAGVGLYGVVAYSVAQRTREIGIRMALGADAGNVRSMVVRQAMRLTLIGLVIGLAGAFALTRFMSGVLTGVSPTDPPTFTIVSVLLALSGVIAAWVPAHRATRVDPMVALRYE